ncbi:hypothetical protein HZS_980, partial [Henneguya salminicola]
MLRLTDVKLLLLSSETIKNFKYWVEVVLDLLLIGLFLLVILSWQSIFYTESAGLTCVITDENNYDLQISDGRYITSRCLLESAAKYSLFYPYFQFLQFTLLLIAQVMWYHVPKVKSKLDLYFDIFNKIYEIEPKFEHRWVNIVPVITIDKSNEDIATLVYDKLIFLITEKSCIAPYYIAKNIISLSLTLIFISANLFWVYTVIISGVDFSCDLNSGSAQKKYPPISCNISPFYFFMGYLCLFQILLVLIFIFNSINLIFFRDIQKFKTKVHDMFGSGGDRLCGLPGFFDFALYIIMYSRNVKDGGFHLQMIKFVINKYSGNKKTGDLDHQQEGGEKEIKKYDKFSEELCIISGIAERLKMRVNLKPYMHDHIYYCLTELISREHTTDMMVNQDIKEIIMDEIKSNSLYFAYLLTGLMKNEESSVKNALARFDTYLHELENKKKWPNNIVLAAASNILRIKIVIVTTYRKHEYYVDDIEVFQPYSKLCTENVAIFSLIHPNYYNLLKPMDAVSVETMNERRKFVTSTKFRHKLIHQTRKSGLDHLLAIDAKSHKRTRSMSNMAKEEAAQRVYDDHFIRTIFPTSKLVAARFRIINYQPSKDKVQIEGENNFNNYQQTYL